MEMDIFNCINLIISTEKVAERNTINIFYLGTSCQLCPYWAVIGQRHRCRKAKLTHVNSHGQSTTEDSDNFQVNMQIHQKICQIQSFL